MQRPVKHHTVKRLLATAAFAIAVIDGGAVMAAELPSYEVSSFAVSPVQVSVLGAAGVQQQVAQPTLTRDDMPASPHQLAVLTPRHHAVKAANETTTGSARN